MGRLKKSKKEKVGEITVGRLIEKYREKKGLTVPQLARVAKVHKQYLYRLERGDIKSPTVDTIQRIAEQLGVSVLALIPGAVDKSIDGIIECALLNNLEGIEYILREYYPERVMEKSLDMGLEPTAVARTVTLKHNERAGIFFLEPEPDKDAKEVYVRFEHDIDRFRKGDTAVFKKDDIEHLPTTTVLLLLKDGGIFVGNYGAFKSLQGKLKFKGKYYLEKILPAS
jgi:transcriptional regulator with XRE-family HTH domain